MWARGDGNVVNVFVLTLRRPGLTLSLLPWFLQDLGYQDLTSLTCHVSSRNPLPMAMPRSPAEGPTVKVEVEKWGRAVCSQDETPAFEGLTRGGDSHRSDAVESFFYFLWFCLFVCGGYRQGSFL